ncbi:MAG: hypothetical protein EYC68_14390 [Chloroflexota bacterium]|nr:MAG: hypothetical protein EYC68_14390 [Chloroflexota bacterium]
MAEVAPSGGGGGSNRNFLLIIGGLAALLFIGLLALAAIFVLPGFFGGQQIAIGTTATPTRIVIPPTSTRTPPPSATLVVSPDSGGPTATLAPGERKVVVQVGANNAVTLTTIQEGKSPVVQEGTWNLDTAAGRLVVTFTLLNGKPFKDEIVFEIREGSLVPVTYNRALHGDLNSVKIERSGDSTPLNQLVPALPGNGGFARPALQATATPEPVTGDYSGTLPPVQEGIRLMILYLGTDSSAVLGTSEAGAATTLQFGTWTSQGDKVTVTLTEKDGAPFEETLTLELTDGKLVGTTTDPTTHGAVVQFTRDPSSPTSPDSPAAGTYAMTLALNTTPIAITATPIPITATPMPGTETNELPSSGLGEDLLLLFGGGILLLGVIFVVRRMRAT